MRRVRKIGLILILTLAFLLSSASNVLADESKPIIQIEAETITDGLLYRIDFSIKNVTDMAGISIDMIYDNTIFDIVNESGNPVSNPIIGVEDLFSSQEGFEAINKVEDNRITYVNMIVGVNQGEGVNYTDFKKLGSLYLKVKDGQSFNGFGMITATSDISAIDYNTVCVKVSDSQAIPILYGLYQAEIESYITLTEQDHTVLNGTYPVVVSVEYPDSTSKIHNKNAEIAVNQGVIHIQLPNDFETGTTISVQFEEYYSTKVVLSKPTSYDDIQVSIDLYAGDLNGDNTINNDDYQAFYNDFASETTNSLSDYNHDNYYDIYDLFYISKNYGKGGEE